MTPILDRLLPVPAHDPYWSPVGPVLIQILIFVGLVFVFIENGALMRTSPLWTLLVLAFGGLILFVVHECAHALAAVAVGFCVRALSVGPIVVNKGSHGLNFGFDRSRHFLGGSVEYVPQSAKVERWRPILVAAAGPLSNLIALLWLGYDWRTWLRVAPTWYLPLLFMAAFTSLSSILPSDAGPLISDGGRLLLLMQKDAAATHCALLGLIGQQSSGVGPAQWDPQQVQLAASANIYDTDHCLGNWLAYLWAQQRGDLELAGKHLESALSASSAMTIPARAVLFRSASIFELVCRRNFCAARMWRHRAEHPGMHDSLIGASSTLLSPYDRSCAL